MTTHLKTPIAIVATRPSEETIDHDRRKLITGAAVGLAAAGVAHLFPVRSASAATSDAMRPFHINIPEADLVDLRRRLAATRWPEKETVTDDSQGVPLAMLQDLVRYWQTDYDWRKVEARLNALPQFITEIDGLDIHFIHVRSKHENALPMIVTHGWPGSIVEQLKIIEPLTPIPPLRAAARPTPSTWSFRRCPATGSPASRPPPAGIRSASPAPGRC